MTGAQYLQGATFRNTFTRIVLSVANDEWQFKGQTNK
jgi:hypothetical protein